MHPHRVLVLLRVGIVREVQVLVDNRLPFGDRRRASGVLVAERLYNVSRERRHRTNLLRLVFVLGEVRTRLRALCGRSWFEAR